MRYVMLLNIGPVQSFIAAARRTRDLWYGSWLLSELSKSAAAVIMQEGGDLIFPAVERANDKLLTANSDFSVVNRIVALVDREPANIAAKVEEALRQSLRDHWRDANSEIRGPLYNQEEALDQVLDLVEFMWTASPCETDNDYQAERNAAEELMAARKNTRNFVQVTWGDQRPKSSLDGLREAMIPEDRYPADADDDATRKRKAKRLYEQYGAGRAERLSAVDLLKRHGSRDFAQRARSTSHIAAAPFVDRLRKEEARTKPLLSRLLAALRDEAQLDLPVLYNSTDALLGHDGYFLYEMRLRDEAEDQGLAKEQIAIALNALAIFYRQLDSDPSLRRGYKLRPSPYYALLLGDGDNMGKVVDGQTKPDTHCAISRDLSKFAADAKDIVGQHGGYAIYAGGDDIMALMPLHTLLDCAGKLHIAFQNAVGSYQSAADGTDSSVSPSLSIGVAIAHHLEPLSDVLALARSAEKQAKQQTGKDAFAVTLSKRSGADRTIVGRWPDGISERLRFLIEHAINAIPAGAAYEILYMHRRLQPTYATKKEKLLVNQLPLVMELEAQRILTRKQGDQGRQKISGVVLEKLKEHLKQAGVVEFANELILARLLAGAERLATGTEPANAREQQPRKERAA